ncbi:MAG TPA: PAS domain S-box protein, partial [Candidatus Kapabacteria bacterium]|nr:PAS domain S-box protein [Candidatus Kapabacteria bacterium]
MNNFELFNKPKIRKQLKNISNLSSLNIVLLDRNNKLLLNIGCNKNILKYLKTINVKSKKEEIEFLEFLDEGIAYIPIYFENKKKFNCFITNFPKYSTLDPDKRKQINCFVGFVKETIILYLYKSEFLEKKRIENRFSNLLSLTQNAMLVLKDDKIYELNDKAEKLLKYSRNELIKKELYDIFPKIQKDGTNSEEKIKVHLQKALTDGIQCFECEILTSNGELVFTKVCIELFKESNNQILFVSIYDLSQQKALENELLSKDELFKLLFDKSDDAHLLIKDYRFIDCNNAAVKMINAKSKADIINKHPSELSPEYQPDGNNSKIKAEEIINSSFEKNMERFVWMHKKFDGTNFPVEVLLTCIQYNNDTILHTTWRDLSFRKSIELELSNQKEFLRHIIDSLPNFVFVKDYDGKFILANKTLTDHYGTTTTDIIGRTDENYNENAEEVNHFLKADRLVIDSGLTKIIHEEPVTSSSGETRWYKTIKIPLKNDKGIFDRVLGLSIDITNSKLAMETIRESQERFKTLANKAPISIIYFDKDGVIQFVNDYHLNKIVNNKVDKEYFIGRKINNIAFYKSSALNIDFESVLKGEFIELNELKIPNYFDGKDIYLNIKAAPINKNGSIIGGIIINEIVSDAVVNKKQLILSENRYKAITDVVTDVIISFKINKDLTAVPEWITKGVEKITGYHDYDTILNEKWIRLIHPDDIKIIKELIKSSVNNEMNSKMFRIITKHKNIKWLQVYTNPYFSKEENRVTYVYVAAKDITDKKNTEEAYLETQRALLTLMSNLPGMVYRCLYDEKWTMKFVSDGCYTLTGYYPDDLLDNIKTAFLDLIYYDDRTLVHHSIKTAVEQASPWEIVYRITNKNNELRWVWEQGQAVFDTKTNNVIALEGFILDITDTKRAEDALKESEERYRMIFMNSPFGIIQYDKELNLIDFNDRFSQILNTSRKNILLYELEQLKNKKIIESLRIVFSGHNGYFEGIYKTITSKISVHISIRSFPVYNDKDEIIGGTAIIEDISKQVWAKQVQDVTYQITLAASSCKNLVDFAKQIQIILGKIIDTTNFFIAFYDKEKDLITLPYFADEEDSFQEFPAGKTLTSYVVKNNKPLLANTKLVDEFVKQGIIENFGTPSELWMGVPLVCNNEVIGAVVVQHYTDENAYDEEDLKLLIFISEQIAQLMERLQMGEEIRLSEIKYRTLTEQLPVGVYRTNKDGIFLYANLQLAKMLKYDSVQELMEKHLNEILVQPRNLNKYLEIYKKEGIITNFETNLRTKDGQIIWVRDTFSITFNN